MKLLILGLVSLSVIKCDVWQYPELLPNGVLKEDENWGGICEAGKRQSPVDLNYDATVKGQFLPFIFEGYDKLDKQNFTITNNGHSIQVTNGNFGDISIKGGGLGETYVFDQFHFHWSSEHTIQERRFGLEMHLVHYEEKFDSLAKAAKAKNGVAVLSVLFHIAEEDNPALQNLLHHAESLMSEPDVVEKYTESLVISDFMPANRISYFRYEGSLTTPGCAEDAIWTVFETSLPISAEQVERFKLMKTESGHELTHNYRSLKPLNDRVLVYVSDESDVRGSGTIISSSFGVLTVLLSAIFVFRM